MTKTVKMVSLNREVVADCWCMVWCAWQLRARSSTWRRTTSLLRRLSSETLSVCKTTFRTCAASERRSNLPPCLLFIKDERNDGYNNKKKSMLELQMKRMCLARWHTEKYNTKYRVAKSQVKRGTASLMGCTGSPLSWIRPSVRNLGCLSLVCVKFVYAL